jgi:hypothetical protein
MTERAPRTQNLVARREKARHSEDINSAGRTIPIHLVAEALIKAGYLSLDDQAKALGLHRSTAWTIMKTKHKLGMLNNKTVRSILAHPDTPVSVRVIIRTMLDRKKLRAE